MKRYLPSLLGFLLGMIFYASYTMAFIGLFIGLILCHFHKKEEKLKLQEFKDLLNGIYSELMVGKSFRNALDTSLTLIDFSPKMQENLELLNKRIRSGVSELQAWQEFSLAMKDPYISKFVETLTTTYTYSGHVTYVIRHAITSISDAIDLTLEIEIIIASKKFEFMTMMTLPLILLSVLGLSQYDYMAVLYESALGRCVMTCVLVLYLIAYLTGKRIIKII